MIVEMQIPNNASARWHDRKTQECKDNAKTSYAHWESWEIRTLIAVVEQGEMTQPQIALMLRRTYPATSKKIRELKRKGQL